MNKKKLLLISVTICAITSGISNYNQGRRAEQNEFKMRQLHELLLLRPDTPPEYKERALKLKALRDSAPTEEDRQHYQKALDRLFRNEGMELLATSLRELKSKMETK